MRCAVDGGDPQSHCDGDAPIAARIEGDGRPISMTARRRPFFLLDNPGVGDDDCAALERHGAPAVALEPVRLRWRRSRHWRRLAWRIH